MSEFSSITNTSYNKRDSDKKNLKKYLLTGKQKCIFNVRKYFDEDNQPLHKDHTKGKNTECCSKLQFKLKKPALQCQQSSCDHFDFEMDIEYEHNHVVEAASALKLQY